MFKCLKFINLNSYKNMPKKQADPAEKLKAFDTWKESDEFKAISKFMETRGKDDDVDKVDLAYKDIWQEWQPVLDDLFAMVQAMKVPGRKAKGKFQIPPTKSPVGSLRTARSQNDVLRALRINQD
jgi:hypothetical protein